MAFIACRSQGTMPLQLRHPRLAFALLALDMAALCSTLLVVDPAMTLALCGVLAASVLLVPIAYWRFRLDADRRLRLCVAQCYVELQP